MAVASPGFASKLYQLPSTNYQLDWRGIVAYLYAIAPQSWFTAPPCRALNRAERARDAVGGERDARRGGGISAHEAADCRRQSRADRQLTGAPNEPPRREGSPKHPPVPSPAERAASGIGGCAPSLITIQLSKIKPRRVWEISPEPKASPRSGCPSRGGRQLGSPKRRRPHVPSCLKARVFAGGGK